MLSHEVKELFDTKKCSPTLVVTIGNSLRLDDGVGPYIAEHTCGPKAGITIYNAKNRPENILAQVEFLHPKRTIIIDAADFGGSAGEARIIPEDILPHITLSTHFFPIPIVSRILYEDTGTDIAFVGIQAKFMGMGEGLSEEIEECALELIDLIKGG